MHKSRSFSVMVAARAWPRMLISGLVRPHVARGPAAALLVQTDGQRRDGLPLHMWPRLVSNLVLLKPKERRDEMR